MVKNSSLTQCCGSFEISRTSSPTGPRARTDFFRTTIRAVLARWSTPGPSRPNPSGAGAGARSQFKLEKYRHESSTDARPTDIEPERCSNRDRVARGTAVRAAWSTCVSSDAPMSCSSPVKLAPTRSTVATGRDSLKGKHSRGLSPAAAIDNAVFRALRDGPRIETLRSTLASSVAAVFRRCKPRQFYICCIARLK